MGDRFVAAAGKPPADFATSADEGPRIRTVVRVPLALSDRRTVPSEIVSFDGLADEREHFAVRLGPLSPSAIPLVRLHSECVTGDVLGSARCDCGPQLREALGLLSDRGGYLLYLRQEGRGIGLYQKLDAYRLQEQGLDTFTANRALGRGSDERSYGVAAAMLRALGLARICLLSNNLDKRAQLMRAGIDVAAQEPTGVFVGAHNRRYLEAKARYARHTIDIARIEEMQG